MTTMERAGATVTCLAVCLALVFGPSRAEAQERDQAEEAHALEVRRADALRLGAERNPFVAEARRPLPAVSALGSASKTPLSYAPRAQVSAGRREGAFGSGLEISGSVFQDLSIHGLGSARTAVSSSMGRATRSELERVRLDGASAAAIAWVDLLEAQELVRLRALAYADAQDIARVAKARVGRGVSLPVEGAVADSEVGTAEIANRDAEGMTFEASARLNFALGEVPNVPVVARGDLYAIAEVPARERPPTREHPATMAAHSRVDLAAADVKLARAYGSPPLGVGVTFAREGQGEQVFLGTLSVPLPVLDPSRFETSRQKVYLSAAEATETRVRAQVAHDLALAEHERLHTREVQAALRTRVVDSLREAVRLARSSYDAGTADMTSLLIVRQRLVAAEEQLARASAEVQRADIRYGTATGTLLDEAAR
ncbi:Heavy metal RND efflux outer membrane protein, CzcC family [Labilithrix luteola]|uniref:Heavy metal RND efflux outer membrane protein, CzcC family n=1 Tax=Labilithrix luteola TaxID=1391654 RepID=A0A0K1PLM8_9BACT|nr:TolC family protein [Labilithrix luteola]AKU94019.1 Heavy metal RND efflux outer membrane protein, CzcC family [Labilithrix luteola]